jgi:hypothetical protein
MLGALQAVLPGAAAAQPVRSPISLWSFDETSGTTFADLGPAHVPMTIVGTWASLTTASMVQGVGGTSAYTNGSGSYATIPANDPDHNLGALTISFYYERNSATIKHILLAAGNGSQAGDFSIEVLPNGRLRGYHVGQDAVLRFFESTNGITGTNLQVGTAHRIDVTFGSLGARIYLDGAPLSAAFILANTNGWNNTRVKYLGVFTDGIGGPADGAFDRMRLWNRQLTDSQIASLEPAVSITLASQLPLVPAMDFLASDGILPGSGIVYVYDTNLGNGSGSSALNAKEIQAAINAATAGQTLVAVAATPGDTTSYNRTTGLNFPNSGSSGSPITLMARPGDTVIIDKSVEFAAYRTTSSGLNTKWELFDASKKIWRSVAATFGSTVRPLGGVWFEGGWPHYILPAPDLTSLQAPVGLSNIWTNYGGPCALVHTDGRIYIRMQRPFPGKMSANNKWPTDGRLDYIPGWISKGGAITAGQLGFPATEDPRDVQVWLAHSPGGGANAKVAFTLTNRSYVTIGEGINSFGYGISMSVGGASNITFKRGTDFSLQYGITPTSTAPGPITLLRRRMTHGSIKHQPLVQWKFGGPLENSHRGAWAASGSPALNNLVARDCTWHGWHDFCTCPGNAWDIQQCTFVQIMDDGFQIAPSAFTRMDLHYCYFLDSAYGGPGDSGDAPGPMFISHSIFDNRCPRYVDCMNPQGDPFFMPLMQLHLTGGGEQPLKWYNNTVIWSPDTGGNESTWMACLRGDNPAVLGPFHEVFNCIWVRTDYQRYTGTGPSGGTWEAQNDEIVSRCVCGGGSKEIYDYIILHRDVPNAAKPLFLDIVDTPVRGQAASSHGAGGYTSLANWLSGTTSFLNGSIPNKFNESKVIYSPGFFANSYQVNPQISSCPPGGVVPDFDTRRSYRPAAAQANNGYSGTTNSPAGQSMASWKVLSSPWIGALDPHGSSVPVGVQNP